MFKRLFVVLILICLLSACSNSESKVYESDRFNEHGVLFDVEQIDLELKDKYYYKQLNAEEKLYYQALYYASKNYSNTIEWTFFPDSMILQQARRAFIEDNPLYYWINYQNYIFTDEITVKDRDSKEFVYYKSTPENSNNFDIKSAIRELEKIGDRVAKECYDDNPYEYVKNIHDYICLNVDYVDGTENQQTLYGALIDKECVCEGYARAFQYLTNKAGFECVSLNGVAKFPIDENNTNINHAWNKIKINDYWYFVDTTWDDQVLNIDGVDKNIVFYSYFLLNDDYGNIDHRQSERFSFEFPVCDDPVMFHLDVPVCGFDDYDEKKIDDFVFHCLNSKFSYIVLRFINNDDYLKTIDYFNSQGIELDAKDLTNSIVLLISH